MDKESRLRVYFGPNDRLQVNKSAPRRNENSHNIVVRLGDILDPLVDAIDTDRTWLKDFREDEVTISKDFHEVLIAYRKMKKSA